MSVVLDDGQWYDVLHADIENGELIEVDAPPEPVAVEPDGALYVLAPPWSGLVAPCFDGDLPVLGRLKVEVEGSGLAEDRLVWPDVERAEWLPVADGCAPDAIGAGLFVAGGRARVYGLEADGTVHWAPIGP